MNRWAYAGLGAFALFLVGFGMNLDGKIAGWLQARGGPGTEAAEDYMLFMVHPGATRENAVLMPVTLARLSDPKGDGIDAGDVKAMRDKPVERRLKWLKEADRDGDGRVGRAEIVAASGTISSFGEKQADRNLGLWDADRDGFLTEAELRKDQDEFNVGAEMLASFIAFDRDHDGKASAAEVTRAAERFFDRVDRNRNGTLDEDEVKALDERKAAFQKRNSERQRAAIEREREAEKVGRSLGR